MNLLPSTQDLMPTIHNGLGVRWLVVAVLLFLFGCGDEHPHDHTYGQSMPNTCVIVSPSLSLGNGIEVLFSPPEEGIPLNELFTLGVTVNGTSSPQNVTIFIDATMPAHGHGMLTMVDITPSDEAGRFDVSKMILHMPGEWELSILVVADNASTQGRSVIICSEG